MESLVKRLIDRLCRVQRLGTLLLDPGGEIFTALGRWQNMAVAIDGALLDRRIVTSRDLKTFTSPLCVSAGVHRDCDSVLKQSTDEKWGLQPLLETVCIDALADQRDPTLGDEASWRSARR